MTLSLEDQMWDNARLTEELQNMAGRHIFAVRALEIKNKRLYARIEALQELLALQGISIPDWPSSDVGGV